MVGKIGKAEKNLQCGIRLSYIVNDDFYIALGHQELALLYSYKGAPEKATEELRNALSLFRDLGNLQSEAVVWQYFTINDILAGEPGFALLNAQRALALINKACRGYSPINRDFLRIQWLLGWSLVALAEKQKEHKDEHLAKAEVYLRKSLIGCRRNNLVELEPDVLLAWARWHYAGGDSQHGRESAEQALAIADRCGYRLKKADIHNFLACLALVDGNKKIAKEHAEIANKNALCDGLICCYRPALEEACHLWALVEKNQMP